VNAGGTLLPPKRKFGFSTKNFCSEFALLR
jgi:hypothetical protein